MTRYRSFLCPHCQLTVTDRLGPHRQHETACAAKRTVETSMFHGEGAIMSLILAHVRCDYWYAPRDSMAFKTAEKFLKGGTCRHATKDGGMNEYDWTGWRNDVVGSLNIDLPSFVAEVMAGPK